METKKPTHTFAAGGVRIAVWKNSTKSNDGQESEYFTAKLERRYMDTNGTWQSTGSLRVNDVPKARLLLDKAYECLVLKPSEGHEEVKKGSI